MAAQVVPSLEAGRVTDQAVSELRQEALRSRFWHTRLGDWLLMWFWKSRLGLWFTRRFGDATPEELHGYAYWGPVALAIAVTEILGALSKTFRDFIPWPTISGTVGHLEDLNSLWAVAVVALIAATAFDAISREESASKATKPVLTVRGFKLHYGWPLVFAATALVALIVRSLTEDKFHLAYAIYGSFAVIGIDPHLAQERLGRVPGIVLYLAEATGPFSVGGDRCHRGPLDLDDSSSPLSLAGPRSRTGPVRRRQRRQGARQGTASTQRRPNARQPLIYSTQGRNIVNGQNAWSVYFSQLMGNDTTYLGCVVTVTAKTATLSDECLNK